MFDSQQKTLLADRGEIRVGSRYQAEVPSATLGPDEVDERNPKDLETLIYNTENGLTEKEIEQYLTLAKYDTF